MSKKSRYYILSESQGQRECLRKEIQVVQEEEVFILEAEALVVSKKGSDSLTKDIAPS